MGLVSASCNHTYKQTNTGRRHKQQENSFVKPESEKKKSAQEESNSRAMDGDDGFSFSVRRSILHGVKGRNNPDTCNAATVNSLEDKIPPAKSCRKRSHKAEINSSMSGSEVPYHSSL